VLSEPQPVLVSLLTAMKGTGIFLFHWHKKGEKIKERRRKKKKNLINILKKGVRSWK